MFPPDPVSEDPPLHDAIVRIVSSLPETHPARIAFDEGATPTVLLRLLKDDTKAYDDLIRAVMDWTNRVLQRTRPAPDNRVD